MTNVAVWRTRLAHALPFYYGWVIAGNGVALSLSTRTVMAVATLSVFVVPMTQSMGWSVGMFSGAVSLGGLVAVFISPYRRQMAGQVRSRRHPGGGFTSPRARWPLGWPSLPIRWPSTSSTFRGG